MDAGHISDEVVTAGAALAGLILVFLGNVAIGYEGYDAEAKSAVLARFRRRGWFAFAGITASLLSVLATVAYNICEAKWLLSAGVVFLVIALLISFGVGLLAALDIK